MMPERMIGRGLSSAFSPASRPLAALCWFGVGALVLQTVSAVSAIRSPPTFAFDARPAVQVSVVRENQLLPVLVLHDSRCLEFLWFARQARLRLSHRSFASPVVVILFDSVFPSQRTRVAEQEVRAQGFPVVTIRSREAFGSLREVTPSVFVTDLHGRLRAAFAVPSTPSAMRTAINAIAVVGTGNP